MSSLQAGDLRNSNSLSSISGTAHARCLSLRVGLSTGALKKMQDWKMNDGPNSRADKTPGPRAKSRCVHDDSRIHRDEKT